MRKGMGRGKGSGWKNMMQNDSHRHSLASRGIKSAQKINMYKVTVPPTMQMGSYSTTARDREFESKEQEALWDYNSAREHDGLPPVKRMPKGTKYEKDTDGDGVPDSKDCQPLNPNFQETTKDTLKIEFDAKKESFEYKDYYKEDQKTDFFRLGTHTEENPLTIDDYPYGFNNRTQIRYYIETTGRGDRFVSQTLNPRTGQWNKPKKSTYSDVMVMVGDEKGHVTYISTSLNDKTSKAKAFLDKFGDQLTKTQKVRVHKVIGWDKAMDKVEVKVEPQRMRNRETGEIKTQVDIFELGKYDRIDSKGNIIDEDKEKAKKKKTMEDIGKYASYQAQKSMAGESE